MKEGIDGVPGGSVKVAVHFNSISVTSLSFIYTVVALSLVVASSSMLQGTFTVFLTIPLRTFLKVALQESMVGPTSTTK